MRSSFDSRILSLYLVMNRAAQRSGGRRETFLPFGKGFRAPPLRSLSLRLTEAGKEGQTPLTRFYAGLPHRPV
ncbi:hypothetical protein Nepgr_033810 [Nepenthes gracilis]|uniref:Uncharacterized protein n=1 Tax=Nepenthes gracilis TaxID=150966 RepID=A0AAD3Y952_NEPGR|nr:hypothetical protein Nepgr_033810 [Nepenthes gracilis]